MKRHKINKIVQIGNICYALTQGKHIKVEKLTGLDDVPNYEHCQTMVNKTYKCLQEYSVAVHGRRRLFVTGGKVNELTYGLMFIYDIKKDAWKDGPNLN